MINRIDIKGDVVDKISMDIFEAVERYEGTDVVTVASAMYLQLLLMAKSTETNFENLSNVALDIAKQILKKAEIDIEGNYQLIDVNKKHSLEVN